MSEKSSARQELDSLLSTLAKGGPVRVDAFDQPFRPVQQTTGRTAAFVAEAFPPGGEPIRFYVAGTSTQKQAGEAVLAAVRALVGDRSPATCAGKQEEIDGKRNQ